MNRQIKFRIWNSKTSEWVHGPGKEVNLFGEMILLGGFMKNIPLTDWDDCVILQFTGLKDSTGVEIYEGDILTWDGPYDSQFSGNVIFNNQYCKFSCISVNRDSRPTYEILRCESRVIGNIFENKELI
jgi:uncharacterized phage protein (TIGR01671 family)